MGGRILFGRKATPISGVTWVDGSKLQLSACDTHKHNFFHDRSEQQIVLEAGDELDVREGERDS